MKPRALLLNRGCRFSGEAWSQAAIPDEAAGETAVRAWLAGQGETEAPALPAARGTAAAVQDDIAAAAQDATAVPAWIAEPDGIPAEAAIQDGAGARAEIAVEARGGRLRAAAIAAAVQGDTAVEVAA